MNVSFRADWNLDDDWRDEKKFCENWEIFWINFRYVCAFMNIHTCFPCACQNAFRFSYKSFQVCVYDFFVCHVIVRDFSYSLALRKIFIFSHENGKWGEKHPRNFHVLLNQQVARHSLTGGVSCKISW